MDWVQWYYATLLTVGIIVSFFQHGESKKGFNDFRIDFISLVIGLPITGRIFGWW